MQHIFATSAATIGKPMATAQQRRETMLKASELSSPSSPRRSARVVAGALQAVTPLQGDGSARSDPETGAPMPAAAAAIEHPSSESAAGAADPTKKAALPKAGAVQLPACFGLLQPTESSVEAGKARLDLHRTVHQASALPYPFVSRLTSAHVQLGKFVVRMFVSGGASGLVCLLHPRGVSVLACFSGLTILFFVFVCSTVSAREFAGTLQTSTARLWSCCFRMGQPTTFTLTGCVRALLRP